MSDDASPRLSLPYSAEGQAGKPYTLNEALALLDGLVQAAARSRTVTTQPAEPADGDAYVLPAGAAGDAWSLEDEGALVRFESGAWTRLEAPLGAVVFVADEALLLVKVAEGWRLVGEAIGEAQNLGRLGIGTAADAGNPFTAKLNAVLWTALGAGEGGNGDLRMVLNKQTTADVGSLIFQTDYAGRAELGLVGDDALTLKVSADGATWRTALSVDPATGKATLANRSVAYAAIQDVSAGDRLLGRVSGSGPVEEIVATAFARSLLDDANAVAARATLGALGTAVDVQTFAASGTWTKPAGAVLVRVIAVGGGGGGGGGGRASSGSAVSGGAGGGGGGRAEILSPASVLSSTASVVVGAGGAGGGGASVAGSGAAGGAGAASLFSSGSIVVQGRGGGAGAGGGIGAASGGGAGGSTRADGGSGSGATAGGNGSSIAGGAGSSGGNGGSSVSDSGGGGGGGSPASGGAGGQGGASFTASGGGGGGGGVSAAGAFSAGGLAVNILPPTSVNGGATDGAAGQTGAALPSFAQGGGGSGGASSVLGAGGAGGVGALGGGGGGGGASIAGGGGAGGAGGSGQVVVISYF